MSKLLSGELSYRDWIQEVSKRFKQSQLKAAICQQVADEIPEDDSDLDLSREINDRTAARRSEERDAQSGPAGGRAKALTRFWPARRVGAGAPGSLHRR